MACEKYLSRQAPPVFFPIFFECQFTLLHRIGLQAQQHDAGLGQLEARAIDGRQSTERGGDDYGCVGTGPAQWDGGRAAVLGVLSKWTGANEHQHSHTPTNRNRSDYRVPIPLFQ